MHPTRKGYSYLIRPISISIDLLLVVGLAYYFLHFIINIKFLGYLIGAWIVSTVLLRFYEVYRFTRILKIISLLVKQAIFFLILIYAYYGLFRVREVSITTTFNYVSSVIVLVGLFKILVYNLLRRYRSYLGGNNRQIIIIGSTKGARQLETFFRKRRDLGYHVAKVFSDKLSNTIKDSFQYLKNERVDEIYCAVDEVSDSVINKYVTYADQKQCVLKFIPNDQQILSKKLKTDYYEYLPILSIPEISLNNANNRFFKRLFDILFSLIIIIGILSWLVPLLYILIKIDSKGPLIYSQKRNGINYKEFVCYKFRSMKSEEFDDLDQVKKSDQRVTKLGKFLRRTSIDELPQFINVLFGDMSVVGPRPHMLSYTEMYAKKINKYNFVFRHSVKPGITGLAQVKGFRGEVENDEDIINRIKYDIFYIENWSLLLDLKIIFDTTVHLIKGHEKAY
ncbi:exopolysaccharide biosynthesis polyprenyl glycosylphosphotransferase [Aquimarina sp. ERC-38]|uniref:exopolysaccharide biosynthesis polyprenyl glycosylphosphotransferase n=1 Tax=Aquimarina sp. ERC-38 TaxID=2949996 RepID=UPI0022486DAA|nr:exopolysaccharide biosynthesis polyprenyl glycosylphosphotransferase [Aquimarina sp. ERC-38]UZO81884.1 exopolysaccharide biosynthesis polyprenyl glycosylphosphotransferase [Aquimarina sp. ERC-38]